MNHSHRIATVGFLLAGLLVAGCAHTSPVSSTPNHHTAAARATLHAAVPASRQKMGVVGYELIQTRGPNPETAAARQQRLLKAGKVPMAVESKPDGRDTGEIPAPRAVLRNPARWSRSGAEQPAVVQESSARHQPIPKEVIF